jgi:hypothetical protein
MPPVCGLEEDVDERAALAFATSARPITSSIPTARTPRWEKSSYALSRIRSRAAGWTLTARA